MGKTGILFERKNEVFFDKVVGRHREYIELFYKKADEAYLSGDWFDFFKKNMGILLFPGCIYSTVLQPHALCVDRYPMLTEDQVVKAKASLEHVIKKLKEEGVNVNQAIVDRMTTRFDGLFLNEKIVKTLNCSDDNFLNNYLRCIKETSEGGDVEKLVYACSSDEICSDFESRLNSKKPLKRCEYHR